MSDRPVSVRTGAVPYTVSIHDGLHTWSGDTQLANGGGDAGPDPESQVLGALGACTAITMSMVAARKQWPLTAVHVHLHYTQRGAAGTAIAREMVLDGALDDEQRARLMEVADKCPIHRLLTGEVRIQTRLQAAGGGGDTAIGRD
ncbi:OsmC family protein [Xanthomonas axonopodis pv. cajani]|uniref:OsmC family protein n=1 Tax=Xanthomonas axonopodis TaxID=53413 RepID=UPI003556E67B